MVGAYYWSIGLFKLPTLFETFTHHISLPKYIFLQLGSSRRSSSNGKCKQRSKGNARPIFYTCSIRRTNSFWLKGCLRLNLEELVRRLHMYRMWPMYVGLSSKY